MAGNPAKNHLKEPIEMSNLDDRYENGIHDLLKFIKFDMEEHRIMHQKI